MHLEKETYIVVVIGLKHWVQVSPWEEGKKMNLYTLCKKQEQRTHGKHQVWHGKDKEQTLLCTYHSKII